MQMIEELMHTALLEMPTHTARECSKFHSLNLLGDEEVERRNHRSSHSRFRSVAFRMSGLAP